MDRLRRRANLLAVLFCLLVVALAIGSPPAARAGVNAWTRSGPEGGTIRALAIDPPPPTTISAGTGGGLYKSYAGGAGWTRTGAASPGSIPVSASAIDPTATATLYAGTVGGVFKSTDGGLSW